MSLVTTMLTTITGGTQSFTSITITSLTPSRAVVTDGSKTLASSVVTDTELSYLSGVTSAVQTQLNTKITASSVDTLTNKVIDADSNTITNIENSDIKAGAAIALNKLAATTASRALVSDASGFISASSVTSTELGYLSGADSNIQDQIDQALGIALTANLIIGGDFSQNPWARGTSFTSVANNTYTADRFQWNQSGSMVVNIAKIASAPSVVDALYFTQNCLEVDVTTADASIAAGDFAYNLYTIEGYDFQQIAQRDFIFSFWVNATKTGVYCVSFRNSGNDRSYVAEYTVNASNTWQHIELSITGSPSAGTWDYTNGVGVKIAFTMAVGSTFQTTAGAWQTGNYLGTANQVNSVDSNSNFFRIALPLCRSGVYPAVYPYIPITVTEALCSRYYTKSYTRGTNPGTVTSVNAPQFDWTASVSSKRFPAWFKVSMRTTPTIVAYSPTTGASGNVRLTGSDAASSVSQVGTNTATIGTISATSSPSVEYHYTADAEFA